jgi:hypothetical protein
MSITIEIDQETMVVCEVHDIVLGATCRIDKNEIRVRPCPACASDAIDRERARERADREAAVQEDLNRQMMEQNHG